MRGDSLPAAFVKAGLSEEDSLLAALACEARPAELRTAIAYHLWLSRKSPDSAQLRVVVDTVVAPFVRDVSAYNAAVDRIHGMTGIEASDFMRFFLKFAGPAIREHGSLDDVRLVAGLLDPVVDPSVWLPPLDIVLFRRQELTECDLECVGRRIARCKRSGKGRESDECHLSVVLRRLGYAAQRSYWQELRGGS